MPPQKPGAGRAPKYCTKRCSGIAFRRNRPRCVKVDTFAANSAAAEHLISARKYLVDNYYEEYGGFVTEAVGAAYSVLGSRLTTITIY